MLGGRRQPLGSITAETRMSAECAPLLPGAGRVTDR